MHYHDLRGGLIALNHTEVFWLLVEQQELNYEEHSEWLTKHGTQLIFSEGHL